MFVFPINDLNQNARSLLIHQVFTSREAAWSCRTVGQKVTYGFFGISVTVTSYFWYIIDLNIIKTIKNFKNIFLKFFLKNLNCFKKTYYLKSNQIYKKKSNFVRCALLHPPPKFSLLSSYLLLI